MSRLQSWQTLNTMDYRCASVLDLTGIHVAPFEAVKTLRPRFHKIGIPMLFGFIDADTFTALHPWRYPLDPLEYEIFLRVIHQADGHEVETNFEGRKSLVLGETPDPYEFEVAFSGNAPARFCLLDTGRIMESPCKYSNNTGK